MPKLRIRTIRYAPDCVTEIGADRFLRRLPVLALIAIDIAAAVAFFSLALRP